MQRLCPFVCPSVRPFVPLSVCPPFTSDVTSGPTGLLQSPCIFKYPCVSPSVPLSVRLSVSPPLRSSICPFVRLSVAVSSLVLCCLHLFLVLFCLSVFLVSLVHVCSYSLVIRSLCLPLHLSVSVSVFFISRPIHLWFALASPSSTSFLSPAILFMTFLEQSVFVSLLDLLLLLVLACCDSSQLLILH